MKIRSWAVSLALLSAFVGGTATAAAQSEPARRWILIVGSFEGPDESLDIHLKDYERVKFTIRGRGTYWLACPESVVPGRALSMMIGLPPGYYFHPRGDRKPGGQADLKGGISAGEFTGYQGPPLVVAKASGGPLSGDEAMKLLTGVFVTSILRADDELAARSEIDEAVVLVGGRYLAHEGGSRAELLRLTRAAADEARTMLQEVPDSATIAVPLLTASAVNGYVAGVDGASDQWTRLAVARIDEILQGETSARILELTALLSDLPAQDFRLDWIDLDRAQSRLKREGPSPGSVIGFGRNESKEDGLARATLDDMGAFRAYLESHPDARKKLVLEQTLSTLGPEMIELPEVDRLWEASAEIPWMVTEMRGTSWNVRMIESWGAGRIQDSQMRLPE